MVLRSIESSGHMLTDRYHVGRRKMLYAQNFPGMEIR